MRVGVGRVINALGIRPAPPPFGRLLGLAGEPIEILIACRDAIGGMQLGERPDRCRSQPLVAIPFQTFYLWQKPAAATHARNLLRCRVADLHHCRVGSDLGLSTWEALASPRPAASLSYQTWTTSRLTGNCSNASTDMGFRSGCLCQ